MIKSTRVTLGNLLDNMSDMGKAEWCELTNRTNEEFELWSRVMSECYDLLKTDPTHKTYEKVEARFREVKDLWEEVSCQVREFVMDELEPEYFKDLKYSG